MCNQRERLIGFVYNEGDAAELAEVQRHVESCAECRTEIGQLRAVREDLLAWDVPAYESVWRPFAPAPKATPWFRQVPAWAMAAAATIVLASGFAGGSFAHGFGREAAPPVAQQAVPSVGIVNAAELTAMDKLLGNLRSELAAIQARVETVANRPAVTGVAETLSSDADSVEMLRARVAELQDQNQLLVSMLGQLNGEMDKTNKTIAFTQASLSSQVDSLRTLVSQLLTAMK